MFADETTYNWVEVVERLGISTAALLLCGFMAIMVLRTMLPSWKKRSEAQNALTMALTSELPKIAKNTERVCENTQRTLEHQMHTAATTHAKLHNLENYILKPPSRNTEEK